MTSAELSEWIAMLGIEPWGPYRLDILNAISAYASAAPWCKNTKIGDWLPRFNQSSEPAGDRDSLLAYLKATGGRIHGNHQPAGDQPGLERQGS